MNLQRQTYFSVSSEGVPIRNIADYSPFGVQLDGRTISMDSYRYAFNGMEGDSEFKGQGNSYTTEFRQYDARVGRWLSLDPLMAKFPWQSPYCAMDNNPISLVDPQGDAAGGPGDGDDPKKKSSKSSSKSGNSKGTSSIANAAKKAVDKIDSSLDAPKKVISKSSTKQVDNSSKNINTYQLQEDFEAWNKKQLNESEESATPAQKAQSDAIQDLIKPLNDVAQEMMRPVAELYKYYAYLGGMGSSGITASVDVITSEAPLTIKELIKLNNNRNSVTIEYVGQKIRYDLAGRAHGKIPTPHKQIYNKNFVNGEVKSITRASKDAYPMKRVDRKIVTDYLRKQN